MSPANREDRLAILRHHLKNVGGLALLIEFEMGDLAGIERRRGGSEEASLPTITGRAVPVGQSSGGGALGRHKIQ